MRLPDFIIAGAPRSGTTWLYHLLDRHPDVYMAKPVAPEPKFFLVDELYARGIEYYSRQWFADAPAGKLAGEKSTNYLESPAAAERIAAHLPRVKLVFILREPAARAYSNYCWSRMNGLEDKSFADALAAEDERERAVPAMLKYARRTRTSRVGCTRTCCGRTSIASIAGRSCACAARTSTRGPRELTEQLHRFLGLPPRPDDAQELGVSTPRRIAASQCLRTSPRCCASATPSPTAASASCSPRDSSYGRPRRQLAPDSPARGRPHAGLQRAGQPAPLRADRPRRAAGARRRRFPVSLYR
jgi:hypothetical protein